MNYLIVPAHNEAGRIAEVLKRIALYAPADYVIVVDDGSTDGTASAVWTVARTIERPEIRLVRSEVNGGKGHAMRLGVSYVERLLGPYNDDVVVFLDADGQHKPEEVGKLVDALGYYDLVIGKRSLRQYPLLKKIGNRALSL
ncbi:glycosyltransferase family 2 protein, partial [bacterium]|nr:glycosyltransferase family 2 protein [bacterium]